MSRSSFQIEIPPREFDELLYSAKSFLAKLGYEEIEPAVGGARLFRKGKGVFTAPLYVEISADGRGSTKLVNFDGYIIIHLFLKYGKFTELDFTTGQRVGGIPRRRGKTDFNRLREYLGGVEPVAERKLLKAVPTAVKVGRGRPAYRVAITLTLVITAVFTVITCAYIFYVYVIGAINA